MSRIIPFAVFLPNPKLVDKIISPPYDVVSSEKARAFASKNPYSLLHVTKPEVDFPSGIGKNDDRIYEKALENYTRFIDRGLFTRSDEDFFVYRVESGEQIRTGLVCAVSVDEYDKNRIKRHEMTRKEKEEDRTRLAYTIAAHAEPVMLTCHFPMETKKVIAAVTRTEPLYDITCVDGIRHILWSVCGFANKDCDSLNSKIQESDQIINAFLGVDTVYIADGHHRSAAASRVRHMRRNENPNHLGTEGYNYFPAVIFPADEVRVYKYNWYGNPNERPLADVSIADIMKMANNGEIMPAKSTWFAPKLASGLFVYTF